MMVKSLFLFFCCTVGFSLGAMEFIGYAYNTILQAKADSMFQIYNQNKATLKQAYKEIIDSSIFQTAKVSLGLF
jgi:hypothetical protein